MVLVQLFLPLADNIGRPFPPGMFSQVLDELLQRFGGLTLYGQSPARGLWRDPAQDSPRLRQDALLLLEVMVPELDVAWWRNYRAALEQRFGQRVLLVRALNLQLL